MGQPLVYSLIDKAVFDYHMINSGDKILIGASGGKDSTALIEYFANRKKRKNADFDFLALNIQTEFAPSFPQNVLNLFQQWNVPYKSISINVSQRIKPGKKMSCFWCSTQRRTELINYALQNGFNKIALGHHMDDILETLLMNMLNKEELAAMPPSLQYENLPLTIIRPLCFCTEDKIISHGKKEGYLGFTCTCNFQENSTRKDARNKLQQLTDGDSNKKAHMFASLKNINPVYLP